VGGLMMRKNRIVILGAGYGGLKVALQLNRKLRMNEAEVTLVNDQSYHCLLTSLHKAAAGSIPSSYCEVDISHVLKNGKVKFVKSTVQSIDFVNKKVMLDEDYLPYDYLVLGLGGELETFGIPGLHSHAKGIRSLKNARHIKERIEGLFAHSSKMGKNKDKINILVGGAGPTGIEFVAELIEQIPLLGKKHKVDPRLVYIYNIELAPTVLPGLPPSLSEYARKKLEQKGVVFKLGTAIKECNKGSVILSTNEEIKADLVIWTGGVRGNSTIEKSGVKAINGRVPVDAYLKANDYENVFVVGDGTFFINRSTNRPYPPTAQMAVQQGRICAEHLLALIRKKKPQSFYPRIRGTMVSLGKKDGVGVIYDYKLAGLKVNLVKRLIEFHYLFTLGGIGLASKKMIFKNIRNPQLDPTEDF
jgi:NADH:ubiquinone reductase (H+-translocating)